MSIIEEVLDSLRKFSRLLLYIFTATFVHETGHLIMGLLTGMKIGIPVISLFVGVTPSYEAFPGLPFILTAYAGPIAALLFGIFIWRYSKVWALVSFFYSCLPNLWPFIPGSDAYQAVTIGGLGVEWAILIFIIAGAIVAEYVFELEK